MKRSSSLAALPPAPVPESKWNYQDDMLAANMMLVVIDEDTSRPFIQRNQQGSMGSISSSRSTSRGSLNGWGSTSSRKSYKVDLSSLAVLDDTQHQQLQETSQTTTFPTSKNSTNHSMTSFSHQTGSDSSQAAVFDGGDSWGFFVDSAF
jgi:hypothetical protein